jgi:signal transduction histidine kinase
VLNRDENVFTSQFGPDLVVSISVLLVGVVVITHRHDNPLGYLFLASSVFGALHAASGEYALHGLVAAPGMPAVLWADWLANWITSPLFPSGVVLFIILLFPTGRLPGPRWRILAWAAVFQAAVVLLTNIIADHPLTLAPNVRVLPNPTGVKGLGGVLGNLWVLWPVGIVLMLAAVTALVVRYRRSAGEERQQIKWVVYAIVLAAVSFAVSVPFSLSSTYNSAATNAAIVVGFGIAMPVGFTVAILKYRLYGIDVVVNRTLVYGALAILITGVYVAIAVGIGTLVGSGGKPNLGLSILATAVVAVGFQPVRSRLQHVANRLVYGRRATPYEVLSRFSGRVAETYAVEDVLPRMASVLREGTGATQATVWLRSGNHLRPAASSPAQLNGLNPVGLSGSGLPDIPKADTAVPVLHHGELLGALTVTKRRGESLTPIARKLLDDLAHQAGLVLKNVGLTRELLQRLEELRASRQRLVAAQDQERRRLERNLHDGAQQNLVALKVKLGLLNMLVVKDPDRARATVEELRADADEALQNLRDLARGIYPPLLADQGLRVALEAQARKATVPVVVDADGVTRHPQDVEAAVYFCCLEALQNAQKYAHAKQVTVRLRETNESLNVEVEDDGAGFDASAAHAGVGLTNMKDRLEALGGTLDVDSKLNRGTRVCAQLPVIRTEPV